MELLAKNNEIVRQNLAVRLKQYREMREWDQHDLAAAAGLTASGIRGYEQKTRFPKPKELQKLAKIIGTTPGTLLEEPGYVAQETLKELLIILSALDDSKTKDLLAYAKTLTSSGAATNPGPPPHSDKSLKKAKRVGE